MKLILTVVMNTTVIYLYLIVLLRLLGRRTLTQLSAIDLVVIVLMGSAVETSMVQASTLLRCGFVSAAVLLVWNGALTKATQRWRRFRHLLGGGPVLLVHNGVFQLAQIRRTGLTLADVRAALRAREAGAVENVKFAVLEPDGRINVVMRKPAEADDASEPGGPGQ